MTHTRINIGFEEKAVTCFSLIASQENKTLAGVVRELALEALEQREDLWLSSLADELDLPETKTYTHDEAWACISHRKDVYADK